VVGFEKQFVLQINRQNNTTNHPLTCFASDHWSAPCTYYIESNKLEALSISKLIY
jgi:hypothetical protein